MRGIVILLGVITFLLLGVGGVWYGLVREGPSERPMTVLIEKGSSIRSVAKQLRKEDVIRRAFIFKAMARLLGYNLKAGEYTFPAHVTLRQILNLMDDGKISYRTLTIPEGLSSYHVIDLVTKAVGLNGDVAQMPKEGALLPDTYYYSHGDARETLIHRMEEAMERILSTLWAARKENLPLKSPEEVLILASIVELETPQDAERARVAAV